MVEAIGFGPMILWVRVLPSQLFRRLAVEEFKCKFCNRELQSIKALRSHQGKCKQNPNYKGLSEKQKAHYRICAEHLCKSRRKGSFECKLCGRVFEYKESLTAHSKRFCKESPNYNDPENIEWRKNISEIQKAAQNKTSAREKHSKASVFNNFWEYRSKNPVLYESKNNGLVKLDSTWELKVAKRLDEKNLEWYRPKIGLPYIDKEGRKRTYIPDFYVPEFKCFIEVKSFFIEKGSNDATGKSEYIKNHYPFVIWVQDNNLDTFELEFKGFENDPEKQEQDTDFWLKYLKDKEDKKQKKLPIKSSSRLNYDELIEKIKSCNVDFTKKGWKKKVSKETKLSVNQISRIVDKYPQFFEQVYLRSKKEAVAKNSKNGSFGKHWWTNGKENILAETCPDSFYLGRNL